MRSFWISKLLFILRPRLRHNWFILTIVGIFTIVFLLGSSSPKFPEESNSVKTSRVPDFSAYYKKLQEQVVVDYFDLRAISVGVNNRDKELRLCGRERDHHVPCFNLTANRLAGFKNGDEFDRHCELSRNEVRCLVRPPKDYKIPLRWPAGKDVIWSGNVKITKDQFLSSGSMTKRMMLLEENQIAFHYDDGLIFGGVKDYARQIADMIGQAGDSDFRAAGKVTYSFEQWKIQTVLDIGCGFGSFGAHLVSLRVMPVCVAAYEVTGSQVQLALERGLPAHIGNFVSKQLPYPSLSFDMVHCAQCGIDWDAKDGKYVIEVDRLLKPGGYFVLTSPISKSHGSLLTMKKGNMLIPIEEFTHKICWTLQEQQDETFIWQKTKDAGCSSKQGQIPVCKNDHDVQSYYHPLVPCISGTNSRRWRPIGNSSVGPNLSPEELEVHGIQPRDFFEDREYWVSALRNYWSLLSPLIFSDHPKRPGDEDPLPPYNMVRNVMDMNAHYGGLNFAFLNAKKLAWVMNVISAGTRNTLPLILEQGFVGILHDWCDPFPTYPRTYDMLHGHGILSHISSEKCSMMDLFLEMDRILRPEGWVVLIDNVGAVEMARTYTARIRWEARVIDLQKGGDQRLLVCQKPFLKK